MSGGEVLAALLLLYIAYEAVKGIRAEVLDYRWRHSLTESERYHHCGGCGRRYDATCLGASSEHWRCGESTFRSRP